MLLRYPRVLIAILLAILAGFASFLPTLVTDTRPNSFLAKDNPALIYRQKVKEIFGLSDPLVIAVVNRGTEGIFNPQTLALLQSLTDEISDLPNIDENRVMSLATEKNITASEEGMDARHFLDPLPTEPAEINVIRSAVVDFPLLVGNLVSENGQVTLIVAEILDEHEVESTYEQVKAIADRVSATQGNVEVYVAGEGAIAGYLSKYIDIDAKQLNPLAWAVIMLILYIAYRRLSPALLANVIIAASVLVSLGLMAAMKIPFYMITGALPVILIGISVADTIHIYSHYFDLQIKNPTMKVEDLVMKTMEDMWRPLTLTTLTTMAGFLGLYFSATMPPFKYFGLFAAIGVAVAWIYSMLFLPAAIMLSRPVASAALQNRMNSNEPDRFARQMRSVGRFTQKFSIPLVIIALLVIVAGSIAASRIIVDEEPITIFHQSVPLYQADRVMNENLAGTNALDIVVEASQPEGLLAPAYLQRIEALQTYAEGQPHVGGSTSIVDYLKQMNKAMNGGEAAAYILPDSEELVAQYFLIYSATSDSTDFEEEIDYDYQVANVRLNLNTGSYHNFKPVVEDLQRYIDEQFNTPGIKATLSGRVNLNYHWIGELGSSHFTSLIVALLLVWLVSTLLFRSAWAGLYTLIPVAGAILLVYAVMVLLDIRLGVGTSMFAAVALGLGVDFSIHTLERFRVIYAAEQGQWNRIFDNFYTSTGRALFFNFLAIACGFGVLISSKVTSLNNFGIMTVVAVSTSFVASMTVLPAMFRLFRPQFITGYEGSSHQSRYHWKTIVTITIVCALAWLLLASPASSQELPATTSPPATPDEIIETQWAPLPIEELVQRVNTVNDTKFVTRKLEMKLVDRRGKERVRETVVYRKYYGEEMRTIVFYLAPSNIRNTAFLTWDYAESDREDDQWLYLPAMRKVRRISSADRGDYFMGTDFTYEDIKLDGKLSENDYQYTILQNPEGPDAGEYQLAATPRNDEIAQELGYSRIEFWVDPNNWLVLKGEFTDTKGRLLKTVRVTESAQIDGIWTRLRTEIENHKTGHRTIFSFSEIDYTSPVKDSLFSKRAMERGAP